jgi:hypothetical protein
MGKNGQSCFKKIILAHYISGTSNLGMGAPAADFDKIHMWRDSLIPEFNAALRIYVEYNGDDQHTLKLDARNIFDKANLGGVIADSRQPLTSLVTGFITSVDVKGTSAYSDTKDRKRKKAWCTIHHDYEHLVDDILILLKKLFKDAGYKVLVYGEALMKLEEGTWILTHGDMEWTQEDRITDLIFEAVPVSKTKTIIQLSAAVSIESFINECAKFNLERKGTSEIRRLLDNKGKSVSYLAKARWNSEPDRRGRDLPPAVPEDIIIQFEGVDKPDRERCLDHILEHTMPQLKAIAGFSEEEIKYSVLKGQSETVIRFNNLLVAQLFYVKYNGYHLMMRGRVVPITLRNGSMKFAIQNAQGQAHAVKAATRLYRTEIHNLFQLSIGSGDEKSSWTYSSTPCAIQPPQPPQP